MARPTRDRVEGGVTGRAVDSHGQTAVDPTENVIALTEAGHKRQDDLRIAQDKYTEARLKHVEDVGKLRAEHFKEMRRTEADRLNAIRQVDVTAVRTEADRALQAIQALAATTAINAETLRTALTNTAATIAKQTSDTVGQLIERIAALEKSSYEGVGKQRVADPLMADLMTKVEAMIRLQASGSGKHEGASSAVVWIISAIGLLATIIGIVGAVIVMSKGITP